MNYDDGIPYEDHPCIICFVTSHDTAFSPRSTCISPRVHLRTLNGTLSVREHAHLTGEASFTDICYETWVHVHVLIGRSSNLFSFEACNFRLSIDFSIGRRASSAAKNCEILRFELVTSGANDTFLYRHTQHATWKDRLFLSALKVTI